MTLFEEVMEYRKIIQVAKAAYLVGGLTAMDDYLTGCVENERLDEDQADVVREAVTRVCEGICQWQIDDLKQTVGGLGK